jgi:protocatechuate 3,4-dioxygenase beta subunit
MKFFILLFAAAIAAGQPAQKPGSVEGLVVNSATKSPVGKAAVTLHNAAKGFAYAAVADDAGRFQFPSVEPGANYTITAEAPGFTQEPARHARPFTVAEDRKVTGIAASLLPGGAVSGKVIDADGDPVSGIQIQLLAYGYESGARQLGIGGSGETDDRGEYRLSLLAPGRYYVLSNTRERQPDPPGRMHRSQPDSDYPATFYPAALDISGATPIDLPPGGEVGGIDLRLQKIPLFHIRGKVAASPEGSQNMRAGLFMARCEPGERGIISGTWNTIVSMDGTFDVPHVAPGSYCVTAQVNRDFAYQTVTVSDRDLDNVTLTLAPAFQIRGSVVVEGAPLDNLRNLTIMLGPVDTITGYAVGRAQSDGTFVLDNARALSYSVDYNGLPANAYVKSIRIDGRDAPEGTIDVTSAADSLTLVLATDTGQVTGSLRSANGDAADIAVVLAPAGQSLRHRVRSAFTDANGNFTVTGLAPGDYKAFAFEAIDLSSIQAPEYRQPFESMGTSVTVHPNGRETVDMKVISAGQVVEALNKLR